MDGTYSAAYRTRQLLDLVDSAWQADTLSEDEFHAPSDAFDAVFRGGSDDMPDVGGHQNGGVGDPAGSVLTDRDGAVWSLHISPHHFAAATSQLTATHTALSTLLVSGGVGANDMHTSAFLSSSLATGGANSSLSSVESADGQKWTDRGIAGFAALARNQPNQE